MYQQGTPFFMPYEIHSSVPIHVPKSMLVSSMESVEPFPEPGDKTEAERPPPNNRRAKRPWKFRFQHDLESLWWVMLWIVLYRVGGAKGLVLAKMIFIYSRTPSPSRITFFLTQKPSLNDHINHKLQKLSPYFIEIQNVFLNFDTSSETTDNPFRHADYARIYGGVWAPLTHLVRLAYQTKGVSFQPEAHPDPELVGSNPEPLDSDPEPEASEKKKGKRKAKDDQEYRPRRSSTWRSAAPAGTRVRRSKRKG